MDLGTASLFDHLPAAAGEQVGSVDPVVARSRGDVLLASIRDNRAVINDRQLTEVREIAEWAREHTVTAHGDASTLTERGLDTGLPLAGDGAPLVSDFAVLELAAILGRTPDSGRCYVGQILELTHRLVRLWARVLDGQVPVWKALRVADTTRILSPAAVAFVDRQLARYAARCTWAQVDRLIDEALTRYQPEAAEERRKNAAEARRFDIHLDQADTGGTVAFDGHLDLADALDVEQAIRDGAAELGELGCEESLDVRRAMALGEMARRDLTLDLTTGQITGQTTGPADAVRGSSAGGEERATGVPRPRGRTVDLHLHLSQTALTSADPCSGDPAENVGRLANTKTPVTVEQIRDWCQAAGTIIVRPVIDVAGHEPVDSYEIPDRQARQVRLRDHGCVFPHCTRPAEACDLDHITPHRRGGPTCPCNLAPCCRRHHRLKTHHHWTYQSLAPGVYLWTARTGEKWLVTPGGTYEPDTQPCPGAQPAHPPDQ